MKSYFKILTIILLFLNGSIYQAQVSDTLAYVKSFEANKADYIGQPFSKLLNDMTHLQPKTVWPFNYDTEFIFCKMEDVPSIGMVSLVIFWQVAIPPSESSYYKKLNHFYFTNDERNFYGSKIVKDIYVRVTK